VPIDVHDFINSLNPKEQQEIRARAAELIAEEMSLRELRRARKITQVELAKSLGLTQDGVSRIEKRSDLLLSTLRKTVRAMGGELSLVANFPGGAPIVLTGLSGEVEQGASKPMRNAPGSTEKSS